MGEGGREGGRVGGGREGGREGGGGGGGREGGREGGCELSEKKTERLLRNKETELLICLLRKGQGEGQVRVLY